MRTLALASSLVAVVVLAACTAETTTVQRTVRKPNTSSPPVGEDNENGEHGDNKPAGPSTAPDPGKAVGSETWADGKKIESNVTISEGATVEIAPGATVTVSPGFAITVKGTLKVSSVAKHAKLTGANWTGIVVASGGTLEADGLDIENAASALWTQTGNADAKVSNGDIKAGSPFKMEPGSKLSIAKTTVTATEGSAIAGTFIASYMTYNKGTAGGLTLNDAAGSMTISDSELKGSGGGDYVISNAGKLVKLEYTTISGSHCGIHFTAVDQYTLDHVSDDTNSYGAMLYGSGAGPNTITASNVRSTEVELDMKGTNGPLTVSKSYIPGTKPGVPAASIKDPAAAAIPDAKPRAQQ